MGSLHDDYQDWPKPRTTDEWLSRQAYLEEATRRRAEARRDSTEEDDADPDETICPETC